MFRQPAGPEAGHRKIGNISRAWFFRQAIVEAVRQVRRVTGRAQHGHEACLLGESQCRAKPAERTETGMRPVVQRGHFAMRSAANDKCITMRTKRIRDVREERPSVEHGLGLVAAEPARAAAGKDRTEQFHVIGRNSASGRVSTRNSSPAVRARASASAVGAEIVASIGQSDKAAFSTSSYEQREVSKAKP